MLNVFEKKRSKWVYLHNYSICNEVNMHVLLNPACNELVMDSLRTISKVILLVCQYSCTQSEK